MVGAIQGLAGRLRKTWTRGVLAVAVGACSGGDAELIQRAQATLAPFKKELRQTLESALAKGPESAIVVCAEVAPTLAGKHSKGGAVVGRTSSKLRTPKNAAPPWLHLETSPLEGPRLVHLEGGRVGYAEPIVLQDMCTMCHGKAIAPEIRERLTATYPNDAATGYAVGDVRGAFWVELEGAP